MVSRARLSRSASMPVPGLILAALCIAAFALLVVTRPEVPHGDAGAAMLNSVLLWDGIMPRAVLALITGAALGLSGTLLQRVLRNPIADASTLGIASGAELAMTAAMSVSPLLIGLSREVAAFGGGLAAVTIVLALSWRRGLDPVSVALSGMIVSLIASALSVTLILARGEYAMSIYIWGAGSLSQQDWNGVVSLAPRLVLGFIAALLLVRPLRILALDDGGARSLGLALHSTRLGIVALAVWLAASVTSEVGIIGFLGLAAPAIARLAGARGTDRLIVTAPLTGAGLLFLTDCLTQILGPGFTDLVPTGAATALLGGPLLLFLLPRIHSVSVVAARPAGASKRLVKPLQALAILLIALSLLFALVLTVGPADDGWHVATGALLIDLLPFRLPRTTVAAAAGAMLAAAGFLMQRMTGNPIASPEVLGVSGGAGAGLTVALFLFGFPSPAIMLMAMAIGALAAFLAMITISARAQFSPERMLLAGVGISAFAMAVVTMVLAQGDMRGYILLTWLSGSTNRAGAFEAWTAVISLVALTAPLPFLSRWLTILPLGTGLSRAVGLPVGASRLVLAIFAALMTAIASFLVGPLSLTGLIAPHLARLAGFRAPGHQLAASLIFGAGVLTAADWLSRVVIYPYQVPVGLFAALIGGPYLIWLLSRRSAGE
ncbi:Fe(3+)-hydroxamate ABC transporter permease FhuB [Rhizobium lentis]|uniref:Fe(3+)-hydroxamate ABC transporter permease FhuB n=1 Tax=Rhizobium lentis TaxID=1138194 RepID=UPI001A922E94|nr:Fe(3+)-hydroxamate ABC transporter permease FhuB [Rhizobium lentis]MBX4955927.1 Fe(3+)-hydroxamate ABC transporter permease FhuB [Rhizobium lentis]MBX4985205.1 Fe(3+)-hydroxamate ABC transporter permease FhuB [Rhizobium lentis]MBX5003650.1 Fe(3+)-hydroxamate ABC transporter permease FhuB [Rhizobium lentis]MBX5012132.1 Fe(3+)-hydroxamate ABC transporter permease FhuB [Rhizobium lentis]MBX5030106.1 Fe(3+)-hydroxamate ABC transporter permease FhuB [Rhizobium lentis]